MDAKLRFILLVKRVWTSLDCVQTAKWSITTQSLPLNGLNAVIANAVYFSWCVWWQSWLVQDISRNWATQWSLLCGTEQEHCLWANTESTETERQWLTQPNTIRGKWRRVRGHWASASVWGSVASGQSTQDQLCQHWYWFPMLIISFGVWYPVSWINVCMWYSYCTDNFKGWGQLCLWAQHAFTCDLQRVFLRRKVLIWWISSFRKTSQIIFLCKQCV